MSAPAEDFVRSLLLPMVGGGLLVPSAAVAEVIGEAGIEPAEQAPPWVRGLMSWRGIRLPVISPEVALGGELPESVARGRLVVLHAVGDSPAWSFYAITTRAIPQVVLASSGSLRAADPGAPSPPFVLARVELDSGPASVPDLDALEAALAGVVAGG